jgi:uncharacterized iron-regulated membrane protein
MHSTPIVQFLILLMVANGTPIIAHDVFKEHWNWPIDGGRTAYDGRPWLGPTKTVRGPLVASLVTGLAAPLLGHSWVTGVLLGLCAMGGDLVSSFLKRRFGIKSSDSALGLDQSLEALCPAVLLRTPFALQWPDICAIVVAFFVLEIVLSRVLFRLHIRDRPA